MRNKIFLIALSVFLIATGTAYHAATADSIIKFHSFQGELNDRSDTLHRKYVYSYMLEVANGEMVYIKCSSRDYAVSLCVRTQKGDTLGGIEVPKYYNDKGSYLAYLFQPQSGGNYQLLFTSKDSLEKGKFSVSYGRFNPDQNPFDDRGEFCDMIRYLIQHSAADFQFIVREEVKEFSLTRTRLTDYYLVTPSKCEIEYFTSDVYVCTVVERLSLEKCIQKMKELDYEIKQCLTPQWKITEKKREEVREMYRERFEKEYDYVLYGKTDGDMNEFHQEKNIQFAIHLLIEKNLASGYDLRIILE